MRLVYVDEAGVGSAAQEPFVVVAAVLVDADKKLAQLIAQLNKIVERHVPASQRDGFVLHATELWNGGRQIPRDDPAWSFETRMAIAEDMAKVPRMLQLPVVFGWVRREGFPETVKLDAPLSPREAARNAHAVAYMRCAIQVDLWMRDNTTNEFCMMVVEDNQEAKTLIRETQTFYQDHALEGLTSTEAGFLPLRRIKEDPLFQTKRPSSGLQLADFCAYVFKRRLMRPQDDKMLRFWEPMERLAVYPDPDRILGERPTR